LVPDDAIRTTLAAIRLALVDGGRFAFETRNPLARAWEQWPAHYSGVVTDATGAVVRCAYRVEGPVTGGVVRTVATFTSPAWEHPEVSHGALRFLDTAALSAYLSSAGLVIEAQYGDWTGGPRADTSPEIITIVRTGAAAGSAS
jgi:hypothetical protein